ncbi:MAG: ABC transporter substrate-binding protein [Pseudomonadota bacterium]
MRISTFYGLGCLRSIVVLAFFIPIMVSANTLKIGMSTALEGPAKGLGTNVKLGIEAYFNQINKSGGINGHSLELVALDDGYEPDKAANNMRKLIDEEEVLAVIGNVGTPTAVVTVPIANENKTLLFGAVTGAGLLRKTPADRYVINYRASYGQETAAMVKGLLQAGIKPEEIALFTQNDGYGDAGYNGAISALKASGFKDTNTIAHGRYKRNTTNVEEGLGLILDADVEPKAVIIVGAYAPVAKFITLAKEELPDAKYLNVSFVGSIPLLNALGDAAEGVVVTQVVPHFESDLAGVQQFQKHLSVFDSSASPSFLSLEGYSIAQILVKALKNADEWNRESVVNAFQSLGDFDLGYNAPLSLSTNRHQASDTVWPTRISDGKYVAFEWSKL